VNRDGSPADPATPVIDQGSAVPVAVPIDQAPNGALVQVATATGEAFRPFDVPPGYKWISLDATGVLRCQESAPAVRAEDCPADGQEAEAKALEFIRQPVGDERWALRIRMEPEDQYKEQFDPFAGIH
jgi:hypothetical protein